MQIVQFCMSKAGLPKTTQLTSFHLYYIAINTILINLAEYINIYYEPMNNYIQINPSSFAKSTYKILK